MKGKWLFTFLFAFLIGFAGSGWAADFPEKPKFKTVATFADVIEGLTGDSSGNLYTAEALVFPSCPVYRVNLDSKSVDVVGNIDAAPTACFPLGMAFNSAGRLFIANAAQGKIVSLVPDKNSPPTATVFASGVPGINGLAFDKDDNLFGSNGTANTGIVWKITAEGADCAVNSNCEEAFRIPPMRNSVDLGGIIPGDGVGRAAIVFPPESEQGIVSNGLAFDPDGHLFVADTARGAIWMAEFNAGGKLQSKTGCDKTFAENALCFENVLVAHPVLEGADGVALDTDGNFVVAANERNAVLVVKKDGTVIELFRNKPDPVTNLRNEGPLEFPSSPFISGTDLCVANFDRGARRDNFPNDGGDLNQGVGPKGNIVCMKQNLPFPGLELPVE